MNGSSCGCLPVIGGEGARVRIKLHVLMQLEVLGTQHVLYSTE